MCGAAWLSKVFHVTGKYLTVPDKSCVRSYLEYIQHHTSAISVHQIAWACFSAFRAYSGSSIYVGPAHDLGAMQAVGSGDMDRAEKLAVMFAQFCEFNIDTLGAATPQVHHHLLVLSCCACSLLHLQHTVHQAGIASLAPHEQAASPLTTAQRVASTCCNIFELDVLACSMSWFARNDHCAACRSHFGFTCRGCVVYTGTEATGSFAASGSYTL